MQFFLPGVPQVYYVGLLAGQNDMSLLKKSGVGRAINRRYYSVDEVLSQVEVPVVQSLLELIRRRSSHPAFNGQFSCVLQGSARLRLTWSQGQHQASLDVDFAACTALATFSGQSALNWKTNGALQGAAEVPEIDRNIMLTTS